jgi:lipoyl(octanoyl) transferase
MLTVSWLGRISYEDALALQEQRVSEMATEKDPLETLLLLEHTPVFTMGRSPDQKSLRNPGALPPSRPRHEPRRAGHLPRSGPAVSAIQSSTYVAADRIYTSTFAVWKHSWQTQCSAFGVAAGRREGITGVWVGERKIASIGVGVRRGLVCTDLHSM